MYNRSVSPLSPSLLPSLSISFSALFFLPSLPYLHIPHRCTIDDRVTRVAWLNRSTILYAGNDKWSIDPRVIILVNTPTQYSIMIQNVDVYDEGPYTCSVQTDNHPKTSRVHLIVQGKLQLDLGRCSFWKWTLIFVLMNKDTKGHFPLLNPQVKNCKSSRSFSIFFFISLALCSHQGAFVHIRLNFLKKLSIWSWHRIQTQINAVLITEAFISLRLVS